MCIQHKIDSLLEEVADNQCIVKGKDVIGDAHKSFLCYTYTYTCTLYIHKHTHTHTHTNTQMHTNTHTHTHINTHNIHTWSLQHITTKLFSWMTIMHSNYENIIHMKYFAICGIHTLEHDAMQIHLCMLHYT